MTSRSPEPNRAILAARVKSQERYADSPPGLQATAAHLRARAGDMEDSNDRAAMLRLAAGYEQRANDALRNERG
jgi:hypothetical protein